jgi:carbamoyltransferase
LFHQLLTKFRDKTGCGVLINTSFNVRGEPLVRDVWDAYSCFQATGIDVLAIGRCILHKHEQPYQPPSKAIDQHLAQFELD